MALWGRQQSQPWSLSDAEREILSTATGVMTADDFATLHEAPGDSWNPSEATKRRGSQFASMGETARVASSAAAKPPVKDRRYYQKASMAGCIGRAEVVAHAASKSMSMREYKNWLWKDEPRPATPGATRQAVAWAERQLRTSA
jgi:hypothetical protein